MMKVSLATLLLVWAGTTAAAQSQAVVIANTVLRAQPKSTSKVLSSLRKGTKLKLVSKTPSGPWYHVSVVESDTLNNYLNEIGSRFNGWVHGNAVRLAATASARPAAPTAREDRWIIVSATTRAGMTIISHINPSRIIRNGSSIQYWVKQIPTSGKTISGFNAWLIDDTKAARALTQYTHRMGLYRGNCDEMTSAYIQMVDYWKEDSPDSYPFVEPKYDVVVPDSVGEEILVNACSYK